MLKIIVAVTAILSMFPILGEANEIPAVFSDIVIENGKIVLVDPENGKKYPLRDEKPQYKLKQMEQKIKAIDNGILFDFSPLEDVVLYYGLINYNDGQIPLPVYFKKPAKKINNKLFIPIYPALSGKYDLSNWEATGQGTLGYRVMTKKGEIVYDGRVAFNWNGNKITQNVTIIEGPSINILSSTGAVIRVETDQPAVVQIEINGQRYSTKKIATIHEISVQGLESDSHFDYQVIVDVPAKQLRNTASFSFRTAPKPGTRKPFSFAYASDSRAAKGGGERDIHGVNGYILKKIMSIVQAKKAAFMQFSGDMIDGRLNSIAQTHLQYRNWKRVVEPYQRFHPIYATMGNHEAVFHIFDDGSKYGITADRFPFKTDSAEAVFADVFTMPRNGPISEDGAEYDPDSNNIDFPTYKENVFHYTYDNVAMVVLNSNYLFSNTYKHWYASLGKSGSSLIGGNLHGYLMDEQLKWLETILDKLDKDSNIDYIFVTQHTPAFPNGGHLADDMWYLGNNAPRPNIAGKLVKKGIIEQRDRYLKTVFGSKKTMAILTGDEHNYHRTLITPKTVMYRDDYKGDKFIPPRPLWQINNGAAGAPYYSQESALWKNDVQMFTTQNAVVIFHVNQGGKPSIGFEVINPVSLERIE